MDSEPSASNDGAVYISHGRGRIVVKELKWIDETKEGQTVFIFKGQVLRSASFADALQDAKANPPGTTVKTIINFTNPKTKKMAPQNLERLVFALCGETRESVARNAVEYKTAQVKAGKMDAGAQYTTADELARMVDFLCSDAQPLTGKSIDYATVQKWNEAKTVLLTLANWTYVKETPEEIAANRQAVLEGTLVPF